MDVGRRDASAEPSSSGINEDVAHQPHELLASVVTFRSARFAGLYRPVIDDAFRRRGFASLPLAIENHQEMFEALEKPDVAPFEEVSLYGAIGKKGVVQRSPPLVGVQQIP